MSQQIRLASEKKENLTQNDLQNIRRSIDSTYEASVNSTKETIISQKKEIQDSINKLYKRGTQLKNDLQFYQTKMSSIIEKNRQIHEQTEYQKNQILIAQQKLLIFNTLNEVSRLNKEIQTNYEIYVLI